MAGIPDFLQKYISYTPPSQDKYIKQMNNVPDFLQKYLGGTVGLGKGTPKETTSQPTMGELGYHEQKKDFTNPIVWEQYITKSKKIPTLGDILQLVKLRLRKDFKANIPVYYKTGYRMESPFQMRLDKVADAAGIAALLYATGQTAYAGYNLRKMALGNMQEAINTVAKEFGEKPTLANIKKIYVQMRQAPIGTYSKEAIESADYLLNLRNSLLANNPARASKFGYSFKEMLNNYLVNLPYFGSTPLPRKLKFQEISQTPEAAANQVLPQTSNVGAKTLARSINTNQLTNDPTFTDKLNIINTLIKEKDPLALKLFGNKQLNAQEFLTHYEAVKNSQAFNDLMNIVGYFQGKLAPLRITMSNPQIAETAKQAMYSAFKSIINPADLQNLAFIIFPKLQEIATNHKTEKKQSKSLNLTVYHGTTGMKAFPYVTYTSADRNYVENNYSKHITPYKINVPEKQVLHITYKVPEKPLYDYHSVKVGDRKIDFQLLSKEDVDYLKKRGIKVIDVEKIDLNGKKTPHYEVIALDKKVLQPFKKEVLPPEIPKEPTVVKDSQTFLQRYHKGTTTDILGTPDYEALKDVKQSPEKTLEILKKNYAKIQKNIDTAEQMFLENKIDALTARKKIAEQLQLIKKLRTLNPYGNNKKITQLNEKALKYAKTKLGKIKLTATTKQPTATHSLSKKEQEELTKKGLTDLQPDNNFVYIGVRNPKTLGKILQAGKLKVDKTSEKMGIFGSHHLAIAKDYAKKTGVIFKIPYDKSADISDKIDKRLKQVRLNKDIDLSNAFVKSGNKWVRFHDWKKTVKKPEDVKPVKTIKVISEITNKEIPETEKDKIDKEIKAEVEKAIASHQYFALGGGTAFNPKWLLIPVQNVQLYKYKNLKFFIGKEIMPNAPYSAFDVKTGMLIVNGETIQNTIKYVKEKVDEDYQKLQKILQQRLNSLLKQYKGVKQDAFKLLKNNVQLFDKKYSKQAKSSQPVAKEQTKKNNQAKNQSSIEEALQKDVVLEDEAKRSGNVSLGLLKSMKDSVANFLVTAYKLKQEDTNLWYVWREQMFKTVASVEKGLTQMEKDMKGYWTPISAKDAYDMAILFDGGKAPAFTGEKLKLYNRLAELNKKLENYKIKKGLTGKFQDADITLLDEQIAELEKKGTAKALAKANELSQIREKISKMNYLPRKALLNKYWSASPREREAFFKKLKNTELLSSSYRHRKSILTLAELVNKEILQPKDINFIELTAENYVETAMKEAMRETYQIFEKNGMIKKTNKDLKLQGWVSPYKLGIKDPYLKEKLFHPALAQAFEQYIASQKPRNWFARLLSTTKIAQFIKPNIVWFYDVAQILFRGLYSFNPAVNGKLAKQAIEVVKNKDDLYLHLLEKGLYPMPEGMPKKVLADQYARFARRHITDVSKFKKTLEMLAGHTITTKDKDLPDIVLEGLKAYVDPLANATWTGDKVMRTFGYLQAKRMGYSDEKAIRITREALGDYSVLSNKYKDIASYIFFVYAFRILMPVEMTKTLFIEPMRAIIKKATGNDVPKAEAERILKALLGFFALMYIPYKVMKHFGFKPTGKHLGPLAWKYAKSVLYKGKKKEIVVGYNNIINMPIKYWNRFTSYDPTNPTSPFIQVIGRVGKWEIQPFYRIMIEILTNKPSFSTKPYVYNINDPWTKQVADMTQYFFEQSFRLYATIDDLSSGKTSYAKQQQEIIDTNMKLFTKVLVNIFGYTYVRSSRDYLKRIMLTQLKAERTKRLHKIIKSYTGEKQKMEINKLNSWYKRSLEYINNHY